MASSNSYQALIIILVMHFLTKCLHSFQLLQTPGSTQQAACSPHPHVTNWIDSNTPSSACTKTLCTGSYQQCINPKTAKNHSEQLILVFSDEFENPRRNFSYQDGDRAWTAVDMYYDSAYLEQQVYKPEQVFVRNGALHIRADNQTSTGTVHASDGLKSVTRNVTSGMVQSWNKFCFKGGYAEFSIKLPGNPVDSGFWAAAWLEGNLGRAGYDKSTAGRWPYSYDECEGSGSLSWSGSQGQRVSRCNNPKGRGAPEIDVMEYGIFNRTANNNSQPTFVHTLQMAPVMPLRTSWLKQNLKGQFVPKNNGGYLPGSGLKGIETFLPVDTGAGNMTSVDPVTGEVFLRKGNSLTDAFTAWSSLNSSHFDSYHTYSVLWEPGEYVRWYLDDQFLFEVNREALRAQVNSEGDRVGDRLIPNEAMYLILNLAMSDKSWSQVSPSLVLPATMSVDFVRVYQRSSAVNIGCDPQDFPTQQEIACNKEEYFGPEEIHFWDVGVCQKLFSESNTILIAFSGSAFFITLVALLSSLVMAGHWLLLSRRDQLFKPTAEDLAAAGSSNAEAACYLLSSTLSNPTTLLAGRPDLYTLAACKARNGSVVQAVKGGEAEAGCSFSSVQGTQQAAAMAPLEERSPAGATEISACP